MPLNLNVIHEDEASKKSAVTAGTTDVKEAKSHYNMRVSYSGQCDMTTYVGDSKSKGNF